MIPAPRPRALRRHLALGSVLLLTAACAGDAVGGDGADHTADRRDAEVVRLAVGPDRVPCEGVGPQQCLRIRRLPDGDWELFYDEIAGFTHEPGTTTELLVRVVRVPDPPADGSSLRYELVEVVSRSAGETPT